LYSAIIIIPSKFGAPSPFSLRIIPAFHRHRVEDTGNPSNSLNLHFWNNLILLITLWRQKLKSQVILPCQVKLVDDNHYENTAKIFPAFREMYECSKRTIREKNTFILKYRPRIDPRSLQYFVYTPNSYLTTTHTHPNNYKLRSRSTQHDFPYTHTLDTSTVCLILLLIMITVYWRNSPGRDDNRIYFAGDCGWRWRLQLWYHHHNILVLNW